MYKGKSFFALIPARGGSKRLPKKNLLELGGKPLLAWTIEAGLKSHYIDAVCVSSDDDAILTLAEGYGIDTIRRPECLAGDTIDTFDVVAHALEQSAMQYDYIVLLQPTSPLREAHHVDAAIEQLHRHGADAVVSVCEMEHSPLWSNTLPENDSMEGFLDERFSHRRSQELPTYYRLNGAIYICNTVQLLQQKRFLIARNIVAYRMPRKVSVDIDEALDFQFAEFLLQTSTTV